MGFGSPRCNCTKSPALGPWYVICLRCPLSLNPEAYSTIGAIILEGPKGDTIVFFQTPIIKPETAGASWRSNPSTQGGGGGGQPSSMWLGRVPASTAFCFNCRKCLLLLTLNPALFWNAPFSSSKADQQFANIHGSIWHRDRGDK